MSDFRKNDNPIAIDIDVDSDSIDIGSHKATQAKESDDLKRQAGELFKAAGGVAGAFGKFAAKKGSELKDKIDTEDLQKKTVSGIKAISSKAAGSASKIADKTTEKMGEIKLSLEDSQKKAKQEAKKVEEPEPVVTEVPEQPVSKCEESPITDTAEDDYLEKESNPNQDSEPSDKPLLDALKEELKERKKENEKILAAVKAEEKRLAKEREEAKKSVLRKIKAVDNLSTKREIERDEKKLAEFQEIQELKVAAARSERSSNIARQNKKSIGIIAVIIAAVIAAVFGGIKISGNIRMQNDYNECVGYILSEEYESAVSILTDLNYSDSGALMDYASCQSKIDSYKGKPEDMLNELERITGIENADVKAQYDEAISQINTAKEVQEDINGISISTVDDVSAVDFNGISTKLEKLSDRYTVLVDTSNYDTAYRLSENLKNDTEVAKLINDISSIGKVTLDSEETLKDLRKRYDELSVEDQALIINLSSLTEAESEYSKLKAEKEAKEKAEKEAKEKAEAEARQAALEAEAEEYAAAARDRMTVVVTRSGTYHIDGCGDLSRANSYWETTYGQAKRSYHACMHCNPDTYCERSYKSYKAEYIKEHSED